MGSEAICSGADGVPSESAYAGLSVQTTFPGIQVAIATIWQLAVGGARAGVAVRYSFITLLPLLLDTVAALGITVAVTVAIAVAITVAIAVTVTDIGGTVVSGRSPIGASR